jgi:hypothetical protein
MGRPEQSRRLILGCIFGYCALMTVVVVAMVLARERALTQLSTPKSTADWEHWRDDVRQQQIEPGPVRRSVPKSSEPPALVLMRDYFAVSLIGAVVFSTALYWVMAWFVTGVAKSEG